jgi:hypothetical protein
MICIPDALVASNFGIAFRENELYLTNHISGCTSLGQRVGIRAEPAGLFIRTLVTM